MATTITTTTTNTTTCLLYSLAEEEEGEEQITTTNNDIPTPRQSLDKQDGEREQQKEAINVVLPPTPSTSDDEQETTVPTIKRLSRRDSVSLADLIPVASAALRAKHRLSLQQQQQGNNPPSTQETPLARALTKMKIGVTTHRIKIKYLTNEWIRLALAVPVDETTINSNVRLQHKTRRTREIVKWYEYKFKRCQLNLEELEQKVDELRRQKLLYSAVVVDDPLFPSPPAVATEQRRLSLLVK